VSIPYSGWTPVTATTNKPYGEHTMNNQKGEPSPERIKVLQQLPKKIVEQLTKEEAKAILFDDVWPDSLHDKLKDFLE